MYAGSLRLRGAMGLSFDLAFDFPFAFLFWCLSSGTFVWWQDTMLFPNSAALVSLDCQLPPQVPPHTMPTSTATSP